ncbi:MAG: 4-azaleucine resistance transporter AzlC [Halieaceae bacterium]|jgi:4-azaleucine resistance transporter AzlC
MKNSSQQMLAGALETLPLVIAAFPFGVVFGALAQSSGFSFAFTISMSVFVFAGASQFIAITLLAAATPAPLIITTVFVVNLRQMLYSANLMHRVGNWSQAWRALLAFWLTDETFAAVSDRIARHADAPDFRWFYLGSALFMYSFWQISTAAGYTIGEQVPELAGWGLDVAMIVAFVGIVAPALRHQADWACAFTAFTSAVLSYHWPHQTGLLFSSVLAITVGVIAKRRSQARE